MTAFALPRIAWVLMGIMLCSASVRAASDAIVYPAIDSFLFGNSAVNEVGQKSLVEGGGCAYRYLVPKHYDSSIKYPVVIFLHGIGEGGHDGIKHMMAGKGTANGALALASTANPNNQEDHPCFFVLPQAGSGWWGPGGMPDLLNIINTLDKHYSIDKDRIALTGVSGGGIAIWGIFSTKGGDIFSCGVPMSSHADGFGAIPRNRPIWIFHAANDPLIGIGGSDIAATTLRDRGDSVVYTRYNTGGHSRGTWSAAYQTPLLLPWMLAQQRGQPMQGVLNLLITNSSQGKTLNLSGTADPAAGFTRIGWSSHAIKPGTNLPDFKIDGDRLTSNGATFDSSYVGYRLGLTYALKMFGTQEYFDVVAVPSDHVLQLNAVPPPDCKSCQLFPPGADGFNIIPGTGTVPTWTISDIPLVEGPNKIQVIGELPSWSATNGGLTTVNVAFPVTYAPHPGDNPDTTPPTITISGPTSDPVFTTADATLDLSGTASDDTGVVQITWSSNRGAAEGKAVGTGTWSTDKIPLLPGTNVITVRATDASANVSSSVLVVTCTAASREESAPAENKGI